MGACENLGVGASPVPRRLLEVFVCGVVRPCTQCQCDWATLLLVHPPPPITPTTLALCCKKTVLCAPMLYVYL